MYLSLFFTIKWNSSTSCKCPRHFYALTKRCHPCDALKNTLSVTWIPGPRVQYFSLFSSPSPLTLLVILCTHMDLNTTYVMVTIKCLSLAPELQNHTISISITKCLLYIPILISTRHLKHDAPETETKILKFLTPKPSPFTVITTYFIWWQIHLFSLALVPNFGVIVELSHIVILSSYPSANAISLIFKRQ